MNVFWGSSKQPDLASDSLRQLLTGLEMGYQRDSSVSSEVFEVWTNGNGETIHYADEAIEVLFDGYVFGTDGQSARDFLPVLAGRIINELKVLNGAETGSFNVIVRDKRTSTFYLANDPGGLFPLYYGVINGTLYFSSHLYLIALALKLKPDNLGVVSKVAFGHTFGSRTYFENFSGLNAGEIVTYTPDSSTIQQYVTEAYYSQYRSPRRPPADLIWEALLTSMQHITRAYRRVGVMLSEGFDSRLVAAVLKQVGLDVFTFTHGTRGTKGSAITAEVSRQLGMNYHFDGLESGFPAQPTDLKRQLLLSDNLNIPYWIYGSRYFHDHSVDVVLGGTFLDATLGGHVFLFPSKRRSTAIWQRYREIGMQNLHLLSEDYVERLSTQILDSQINFSRSRVELHLKRRLKSELAAELMLSVDGLRDDIQAELERVKRTGNATPSQLLQRFYLENHARKWTFGQELTLRMNNKIIAPSYERWFMLEAGALHPMHKLHHKTYFELYRKYLPELLRIETGGYNVSGHYPRLVLETVRFVEKFKEVRQIRRYLEQQGKIDLSIYRGAMFADYTARHEATLDYFGHFIAKNSGVVSQEGLGRYLVDLKTYKTRAFNLPDLYNTVELCQIIQGGF